MQVVLHIVSGNCWVSIIQVLDMSPLFNNWSQFYAETERELKELQESIGEYHENQTTMDLHAIDGIISPIGDQLKKLFLNDLCNYCLHDKANQFVKVDTFKVPQEMTDYFGKMDEWNIWIRKAFGEVDRLKNTLSDNECDKKHSFKEILTHMSKICEFLLEWLRQDRDYSKLIKQCRGVIENEKDEAQSELEALRKSARNSKKLIRKNKKAIEKIEREVSDLKNNIRKLKQASNLMQKLIDKKSTAIGIQKHDQSKNIKLLHNLQEKCHLNIPRCVQVDKYLDGEIKRKEISTEAWALHRERLEKSKEEQEVIKYEKEVEKSEKESEIRETEDDLKSNLRQRRSLNKEIKMNDKTVHECLNKLEERKTSKSTLREVYFMTLTEYDSFQRAIEHVGDKAKLVWMKLYQQLPMASAYTNLKASVSVELIQIWSPSQSPKDMATTCLKLWRAYNEQAKLIDLVKTLRLQNINKRNLATEIQKRYN